MTKNRCELKGKLVDIVGAHVDKGSVIGIEVPASFDLSKVKIAEESGRKVSTAVVGVRLPKEYVGRSLRTVFYDESLPSSENNFRGNGVQEVYIDERLVHKQRISYNETAGFSCE